MVIKLPIRFNFPNLQEEILNIIENSDLYPWLSNEPWYSGISLTYNPNGTVPMYQSALGYIKNNEEFDCTNYTKFTPIGETLKWLFDLFPFYPIKSRIAIVDGSQWLPHHGWHRDEDPTVNFRVNIPITGNNNFRIQLDNQNPVVLEKGYAYSWDTSKEHRIFVLRPEEGQRISLVLGFSPWYNYVDGEWIPSKYHGIDPFSLFDNQPRS